VLSKPPVPYAFAKASGVDDESARTEAAVSSARHRRVLVVRRGSSRRITRVVSCDAASAPGTSIGFPAPRGTSASRVRHRANSRGAPVMLTA